MAVTGSPETDPTLAPPLSERFRFNARDFPYWLVAILGILAWMGYLILSDARYRVAWDRDHSRGRDHDHARRSSDSSSPS